MSTTSTPVQIAKFTNLSIGRLDLVKSKEAYIKDELKFMHVGAFKNDDVSFNTIINGIVATNGINVSTYNKKTNYSIGVKFQDEMDIKAFDSLTETVREFVGPDFSVESPVRQDRFYVKYRIDASRDKNKFIHTSNKNITPTNALEVDINRGSKCYHTGELQVWINYKDMKAGISFDLLEEEFED